jgi:glycosyltransferase involved in cell wall biosynthesis
VAVSSSSLMSGENELFLESDIRSSLVPSITVITPSFNQGSFIQRTIESVLSQGIVDLEYIVMDGGSEDQTIEILKSYGNRIKWKSEHDGGTGDAVNKGLTATNGRIIGWLNSDDIYYDGTLRIALNYFEENPEADVLYGDANHIDNLDQIIEKYPTEPWSLERLQQQCIISQPAAFFRRTVIERYGLLDTRRLHCVDYEYWLRLGKSGARFFYLPETLAATRLHAHAKTVALQRACHEDINNILREHLGKVPTRWLIDYAHAVVEERGIARDQRILFLLTVVKESIGASLKWNRGISTELIRTMAGWFA